MLFYRAGINPCKLSIDVIVPKLELSCKLHQLYAGQKNVLSSKETAEKALAWIRRAGCSSYDFFGIKWH